MFLDFVFWMPKIFPSSGSPGLAFAEVVGPPPEYSAEMMSALLSGLLPLWALPQPAPSGMKSTSVLGTALCLAPAMPPILAPSESWVHLAEGKACFFVAAGCQAASVVTLKSGTLQDLQVFLSLSSLLRC
mmetsp:Transcript_15626/g.36915  ORF Transcript_15626/g.36915 Transcript_15626/m.36915 type:complete len:130 (-) Transcript_15626:430-819(-)